MGSYDPIKINTQEKSKNYGEMNNNPINIPSNEQNISINDNGTLKRYHSTISILISIIPTVKNRLNLFLLRKPWYRS